LTPPAARYSLAEHTIGKLALGEFSFAFFTVGWKVLFSTATRYQLHTVGILRPSRKMLFFAPCTSLPTDLLPSQRIKKGLLPRMCETHQEPQAHGVERPWRSILFGHNNPRRERKNTFMEKLTELPDI
jgi:hypothetical protein